MSESSDCDDSRRDPISRLWNAVLSQSARRTRGRQHDARDFSPEDLAQEVVFKIILMVREDFPGRSDTEGIAEFLQRERSQQQPGWADTVRKYVQLTYSEMIKKHRCRRGVELIIKTRLDPTPRPATEVPAPGVLNWPREAYVARKIAYARSASPDEGVRMFEQNDEDRRVMFAVRCRSKSRQAFKVYQLRRTGMSAQEVATRLDIPVGRVYDALKKSPKRKTCVWLHLQELEFRRFEEELWDYRGLDDSNYFVLVAHAQKCLKPSERVVINAYYGRSDVTPKEAVRALVRKLGVTLGFRCAATARAKFLAELRHLISPDVD